MKSSDKDLPKDATKEQQAQIQSLLARFSDKEVETGKIQRYKSALSRSKPVTAQDVRAQLEEAQLELSLRDALRAMRTTRGITLAELAIAQGISTARAGQIEQGDSELELRSIVRQAAALGYSVRITFSPLGADTQAIQTQTIEATPR